MSDAQVRKLMEEMSKHGQIGRAAMLAGMDRTTARKYAGAGRLPSEMALNACVQALFAGRCERPGGATYGRWMTQTLRLVPGKVEVSGDNRSFRTLVDQGGGCAIPAIG